jgi:hypothetical protein
MLSVISAWVENKRKSVHLFHLQESNFVHFNITYGLVHDHLSLIVHRNFRPKCFLISVIFHFNCPLAQFNCIYCLNRHHPQVPEILSLTISSIYVLKCVRSWKIVFVYVLFGLEIPCNGSNEGSQE